MKKLKSIKILLAIVIGLNYPVFAQLQLSEISNPDSFGISSDSLRMMDSYFHSLVDNDSLAGIQTGIITNNKLIHFDSYGFSDIDNHKELNDKNIFRIFSMTKPIVSIALMQLYEKGKFKLEDPLYKHIPEFENSYVLVDSTLVKAENPIRIIDLLRHTSGYNYGNSGNQILNDYYSKADLNSAKTNKEYVKKLSEIPLQFEPGTNWQYGISTNICGFLIEVLSGISLNEYLREFILNPLEMNDTHFQLPNEKINRFTIGYGWHENDGLYVVESSDQNRFINDVTLFNGGGGLVSTTYDYLKFCQMILNGGELNENRIIERTTIDLMLSDHLKEVRLIQRERIRLPIGEASFGLGFSIKGESPESLEQVFGWGGAVGTYFKIDMEHKLAYVMMIQLSPYGQLGLRRSIQEFISKSISG